MNPMQKYQRIIELFACTRKMLALMILFRINTLISSGMCSTPKLSKKKKISLLLQSKATNACLRLHIHQGLPHKPHPLFFQAGYF